MDEAEAKQEFEVEWHSRVRKLATTLEPDDYETAASLRSLEDVQHACAGAGIGDPSSDALTVLKRAFSHLKKFLEILRIQIGDDIDFSLIWGLLGVGIKICRLQQQGLETVTSILKDLGLQLALINNYWLAGQDGNPYYRDFCTEVQLLMIDFLTRQIYTGRGILDGSIADTGNSWLPLLSEYNATSIKIKQALSTMEKISQLAENFTSTLKSTIYTVPPQTSVALFFNRDEFIERIDLAFANASKKKSFQSVGLYGIGGVGKSTVASKYVEHNLNEKKLGAMFWIYGQTDMSMKQSFTRVAKVLELPDVKDQEHDENFIHVQTWLRSTRTRWLIVFDNVESLDLLDRYWPPTAYTGKVIVTARDEIVARGRTEQAIDVPSWDVDNGSKFLMFLLSKSIWADIVVSKAVSEAEELSAKELSRKLDGHAQAISQIAGIIKKHRSTIKDFLLKYEKNPRKAHPTALDAIFEFSFKSLGKESSRLLGVFSFLMPDSIPLDTFIPEDEDGEPSDLPEALGFCSDVFEFDEALGTLLTLALITKDPLTKVMSVHRLVQTQYQFFMTGEQRQQSFAHAAFLIWRAFPQPDTAEAQLYKQWKACEKYIQHVLALKDAFKTQSRLFKGFKATLDFVNLMLACERYLVESHSFVELRDVCTVSQAAISTLDPKEQSIDLKCTLLSHMAIMEESLGNPLKALEIATKGHDLRKTEEPQNRIILAWDQSNLGYTCNTANKHLESRAHFENARQKWAAMIDDGYINSPWPTVQKKNLGRCLVYLREYDEAEMLLLEATREFESHEPINWAMLAYAHFAYGVLQTIRGNFNEADILFTKAQNTWLGGDQTRMHPFNGGCMYRMGYVALQCGKVDAAVKHVQDSMYVTNFHKDAMPVEHARNLFLLSQALEKIVGVSSDPARVQDLRDEAKLVLRGKHPGATSADHTDDYDKFVPIFWR